MMEMDLEDYIEEVKFQMVEIDDTILNKETILDWEKKAREWVAKDKGKASYLRYRSEDEIYIKVKNEEVCEITARRFYKAVIDKREAAYWKEFKLV